MTFRRGDLVLVALPGDFGKPRPGLVVQSDRFNALHPTTTLLPFTTYVEDLPLFRITVEPSPENGLRAKSQVMADKPVTHYTRKLGSRIGRLETALMTEVDHALRIWLNLV